TLENLTPARSSQVLNFLLGLQNELGNIESLPVRLKVDAQLMLLYLQIERNEVDPARATFSAVEELYRNQGSNNKAMANVLAWAALRLGSTDLAKSYVEAGRSTAEELNVYLFPLNSTVAAALDLNAGRREEAIANARASFQSLMRNIVTRT